MRTGHTHPVYGYTAVVWAIGGWADAGDLGGGFAGAGGVEELS